MEDGALESTLKHSLSISIRQPMRRSCEKVPDTILETLQLLADRIKVRVGIHLLRLTRYGWNFSVIFYDYSV